MEGPRRKKKKKKKKSAKKKLSRVPVIASRSARRAVVVAAVRTPFGLGLGASEHLATAAVEEVLRGVPRGVVDTVVWGASEPAAGSIPLGRRVAISAGLLSAEAVTLNASCVSGLRAVAAAARAIEAGHAEVAIAGGSDAVASLRPRRAAIVRATAATQGVRGFARALVRRTPARDLLPTDTRSTDVPEAGTIARIHRAAIQAARRHRLSRGVQDEVAARSYERASASRIPVVMRREEGFHAAALASLSPLEPGGGVTAGNAARPADGAVALLLMQEDVARSIGVTRLAVISGAASAALDPDDQPFLSEVFAIASLLRGESRELSDVGLLELHEAAAAQILATTEALSSRAFAAHRLGRDSALGTIEPAALNLTGGTLAFGHPPAATGARLVAEAAYAVPARGSALIAASAPDGSASALLLDPA